MTMMVKYHKYVVGAVGDYESVESEREKWTKLMMMMLYDYFDVDVAVVVVVVKRRMTIVVVSYPTVLWQHYRRCYSRVWVSSE